MSDARALYLDVNVDGEREGEEYKKAVGDLRRELIKYLPEGALPAPSDGGRDKGLPPGLLNINIGVGDALTELARCLRDWFGRHRQVSIEVTCGQDADGTLKTTVVAKGATEDEIKAALLNCAGDPA